MKSKSLYPFVTALLILSAPRATANYNSDVALSEMRSALGDCLVSASREGFPHYHRPEAEESCNKAKYVFKRYSQISRNNKRIDCANQLSKVNFLLWKTKFLGAERVFNQVESKIKTIEKVCYNFLP